MSELGWMPKGYRLIVWHATGLNELYTTKAQIERALREEFPDESPGSRYARIYYKEVQPHDPTI